MKLRSFFRSGRQLVLPFELISRTIKVHRAEIPPFYGQGYGHKIARKHILITSICCVQNIFWLEILSIQEEHPQREAVNNILHRSWADEDYYDTIIGQY